MIRHLRNEEIDRKKWDECVSTSPAGLIYALSWFLDIVCPEWEALVGDDYESVFPLCHRKKFGINYLFQPFFTQQEGLYISAGHATFSGVQNFLDAIPKKYRLVEIQLNTENTYEGISGFKIEKKITCHLDLGHSIENIRKNYSENLKRNLKKASQNKLDVQMTNESGGLIRIFRNNRGKDVSTLRDTDYITLQTLIQEGIKNNLVEIPVVKNEKNEIIAGAVFIRSLHSYIFIFSAVTPEAREKRAMSFIIDDFINRHQDENMVLDFEGSMDSELARFYKSYGSIEVVYLQLRRNTLPPLLRFLK